MSPPLAPADPPVPRRRVPVLGFALLAAFLTLLGVWWDGGSSRDLRQALPVALVIGLALGWIAARCFRRRPATGQRVIVGAALPVIGLALYAGLFPLAHGAIEVVRAGFGAGDGLEGLGRSMLDSFFRSAIGAARLIPPALLGGAAIGWLSGPAGLRR